MTQLDLIDEHDTVIGVTDKQTAHANRQLHRVVAVYVFNEAGELYVQVHKASGGKYDHSVGGHVTRGEDYATAAGREAAEELGIRQPLEYLATFQSDEGRYLHMISLFTCTAAKTWHFIPNDEVEVIVPMKLSEIRRLMDLDPEIFSGDFIHSIQKYGEVTGRV